jgi:hypothetical protein
MDVTWSDPVARQQKLLLEKQYLSQMGKLMQRCSESLLVILSVHLRTLLWVRDKEYDHERIAVLHVALFDLYESVSTALDYTRIESVVRKSGVYNSFCMTCLVGPFFDSCWFQFFNRALDAGTRERPVQAMTKRLSKWPRAFGLTY